MNILAATGDAYGPDQVCVKVDASYVYTIVVPAERVRFALEGRFPSIVLMETVPTVVKVDPRVEAEKETWTE